MPGIQHSTDLCQRWWDCTTGLGDDWSFFVGRVPQSGWQRPNWMMAHDFLSDSGILLCPFITAIHAGKWDADSGILSCLITRWNPHSWGCLKGDSDSSIPSCLIKKWNWHVCFQRQNKQMILQECLFCRWTPLLLVPGKKVHPNKEVPRKLHRANPNP